jgi:hypothetical protein
MGADPAALGPTPWLVGHPHPDRRRAPRRGGALPTRATRPGAEQRRSFRPRAPKGPRHDLGRRNVPCPAPHRPAMADPAAEPIRRARAMVSPHRSGRARPSAPAGRDRVGPPGLRSWHRWRPTGRSSKSTPSRLSGEAIRPGAVDPRRRAPGPSASGAGHTTPHDTTA